MKKLQQSIEATREYFEQDNTSWAVGFSGGKDSSLVMKILLVALSGIDSKKKKKLYVFYCDTGVEIPVLKGYIEETLKNIAIEGKRLGLDITVKAIRPPIKDRYFVKVIGRGYPPPTNIFRWCTDRLRINPVQTALREIAGNSKAVVVLGTRYDESSERDKILNDNSLENFYLFKQKGFKETVLFCPIVNFTTEEVWEGLMEIECNNAIDLQKLSRIYKEISGECPIIKLPETNPCSKGRFGCWTCTVVRQDKATKNLISNGYESLKPLYDFRSWLLSIRDDVSYRCTVRRNGVSGLGPFRLSARDKILQKLLTTQKKSGHKLILDEEIKEIRKLWTIDRDNINYREDSQEYLNRVSITGQIKQIGVK